MDRMDMLTKLITLSDNTFDTERFKTYVPKFYTHLYTFYSLLKACFISYNDMQFKNPIVIDNSITICFSMSAMNFKILSRSINSVDVYFKCLRCDKFKITLSGEHDDVHLTIKPA